MMKYEHISHSYFHSADFSSVLCAQRDPDKSIKSAENVWWAGKCAPYDHLRSPFLIFHLEARESAQSGCRQIEYLLPAELFRRGCEHFLPISGEQIDSASSPARPNTYTLTHHAPHHVCRSKVSVYGGVYAPHVARGGDAERREARG
jgi:hypothetical protein